MQIELYQALKSVKVGNEDAASVVKALDNHMDQNMKQSLQIIDSKFEKIELRIDHGVDSLKYGIDSLKFQMRVITIMLAVFSMLIVGTTIYTQLFA